MSPGPEELNSRLINAHTRSFTDLACLLSAETVCYCSGVAGRFAILTASVDRPGLSPQHPRLLLNGPRSYPGTLESGTGVGETLGGSRQPANPEDSGASLANLVFSLSLFRGEYSRQRQPARLTFSGNVGP